MSKANSPFGPCGEPPRYEETERYVRVLFKLTTTTKTYLLMPCACPDRQCWAEPSCVGTDAGYPQHTPAYQQSLHDVLLDQYTSTMPYQQQQLHRPSTIADLLQAAQRDYLRDSSPLTSSPFRNNSPFSFSQQRTQQNMPTLQTRTSVPPKEFQLNQNDLDDPNSAPLFAGRQYGLNKSPFDAPGFTIAYQYVGLQAWLEVSLLEVSLDSPAHLSSMESIVNEVPSECSSPQSTQPRLPWTVQQHAERPADISSDSGTYSCTYRGCLLRFDTPAELQKHKREGHQQASPSPTNLALHNSQAGLHKCERINPQTGKPCNSIFSRPYDLTRHEDTIHNGRKIKVQCHLCREEKTFSRNDALTRHMRVVHPDAEWPGKQKRHTVK
jgi:Zinc finger, C2H2 type